MNSTTQLTPTTVSVALATTLASLPLLATAPSAESSGDTGWPPAGWREVETCVGDDPEWCATYWMPPL